jgi:hypothetical protein
MRLRCQFPAWTSGGRYVSFDFSTLFVFTDDAQQLEASNYSYVTRQADQLAAVTQCVQLVEEGADWSKYVLRIISGCESVYKCVIIRRRTEHVLQIQECVEHSRHFVFF